MKTSKLTIAITAILLGVCFVISASAYSLGDVNGDGNIRAGDARKALRFAADLDTPTSEEFAAADINHDGLVRAGDARTILRISADLDSIENYTVDTPVSEVTDVIETTSVTVPEETTTVIEETTTEPVETTTEPVETTTAPVETTTVVEETTTAVEPRTDIPTAEEVGLKYYEKYYIDIDIYEGSNTESTLSLKFATDGKSTFMHMVQDSSDMGVLIEKKVLNSTLNILNFKSNEYLSMSQTMLSTFAAAAGESFDIDEIVDDALSELDISVPYVDSYDAANFMEVEKDGKIYGVCKKDASSGGTAFIYFEKGSNTPASIEYYDVDGVMADKEIFNEISSDPSSYLKIPSGMTKLGLMDLVSDPDKLEAFIGSFEM